MDDGIRDAVGLCRDCGDPVLMGADDVRVVELARGSEARLVVFCPACEKRLADRVAALMLGDES